MNKFWNIFKKKDKDIVKSTKSGRLYIETKDFLLQDKVKKTVEALLKSDLIKEINERQREKLNKI